MYTLDCFDGIVTVIVNCRQFHGLSFNVLSTELYLDCVMMIAYHLIKRFVPVIVMNLSINYGNTQQV